MNRVFKQKRGKFMLFACLALVLLVAALSLLASHLNKDETRDAGQSTVVEPVPGAALAREETSRSQEEGSPIEANELAALPPLTLLEFEQASEYQRYSTQERWRLLSEQSCTDYAIKVLEALRSQGLTLVQAGFLDVSGENWGCVFKGENGESFSLILMSQEPFSPRSDTNLLVVTLLHYLIPENLP